MLASLALLFACDNDRVCATDIKSNPCLTVKGERALPDSLTFLRETGAGRRDSLLAESNCFQDRTGRQHILVLREDSLVTATEWFEIEPEDDCRGVSRTVDLDLK